MLNLQTFSNMTTLYKFYVRYYRTTPKGRKSYYIVESPEYAFDDDCSDCMRNTIQQIISNGKYTIDSYWVESVLVDSVSDRAALTKSDTSGLPF